MRFWTFWRGRRSQSASDAEQPPRAAPALDVESEILDSSHIGFAPLVGAFDPPREGGADATGEAKQK